MPMKYPAPRRVFMTADADEVGGVWSYAIELAAGLALHGTDVALATMGTLPDRAQRRAADRLGIRLHSSPCRLDWTPGVEGESDRAGAWLLEVAAAEAPDLVHLNRICHAVLSWPAPTIVVGHSFVWAWPRAAHGVDPSTEWSGFRQRVAAGLAAARRVVAPTRAMLRALEDAYGPLPHGCVVWSGRRRCLAMSSAVDLPVLSAGRLWDEARNLASSDRADRGLSWATWGGPAWFAPSGDGPGLERGAADSPLSRDLAETARERAGGAGGFDSARMAEQYLEVYAGAGGGGGQGIEATTRGAAGDGPAAYRRARADSTRSRSMRGVVDERNVESGYHISDTRDHS